MNKQKKNKIIFKLKNLKYKLITGLSICTLLTNSFVFAASTTEKELEQQKNDRNQVTDKINQSKENLKEVNGQKNKTEKEVKNLEEQINDYEKQISELNSKIEKSNEEIQETQKQLDDLQAKIVKNKELLDQRLVTMYQTGQTTLLDFILGSESLSDFISKYAAAEQITACDQKLIKKVEEEKIEQEKLKEELDNRLNNLQENKNKRNETVKKLNNAKGEKEEQVDKLEAQAENLEKDIEEFERQAKALDADIKKNEEALRKQYESAKDKYEQNNGGSSKVNFIAPVNGYKITTGLYYSDGRYHGAVDYSGSGIYGQPVRAVADGIVIEAKSLTTSYGRYVMIKHYNGLYTLYAHGSALAVKYGQEVKQGQTIMYVGSSGNSTGPHLHFEVRTSSSYSSRVNPLNYLP